MKITAKRLLAFFLCVGVLLASFPMVFGASAAEPKQGYYYIAPGGSGDGRTQGNPASSVSKVIAVANYDGYGKGDKITIYVSGGEGDIYPASIYAMNWDSWPSATEGGNHTDADILITSLTETPAVLEFGRNNPSIHMFNWGNTTYENIILYNRDNTFNGYYFASNGYDVTIGDNVTFKYVADILRDYTTSYYSGRTYYGDLNAAGGVTTVNNTANNKSYYLIYGSYGSSSASGNHTFVVNGGSINALGLYPGSGATNYADVTLNLVLNNAELNRAVVNGTELTMTGAIQVVANGSAKLPDMSEIESFAATNNVPYYLLTSNENGSITTTDAVGVYTVSSSKKYAYAYDSVNNAKVVYYGEDILAIKEAGKYEIRFADTLDEILAALGNDWRVNNDGTITQGQKTGIYYIAPGGSGDGRTQGNPASSVSKVIAAANNDGYKKGDKITIYVSGGEGDAYPASIYAMNWDSWPSATEGGNHTDADILITSLTETPAVLEFGRNNPSIHMFNWGNTTYENIILYNRDTTFNNYYFASNGYDVTVGDDVTLKYGTDVFYDYATSYYSGRVYYGDLNAAGGVTTINNTANNKSYYLIYGSYGSSSASGNHTFVVNGGSINALGLYSNSGATNYKDVALNLVLNNAELNRAVVNGTELTMTGAIQVIANSGAKLPDMSDIKSFAEQNGVKYYEMTAFAGITDSLMPTDKAGIFENTSDKKYIVAYSATNNAKCAYWAEDALTLEPGSWQFGFVDDLSYVVGALPEGNWNVNSDGTITDDYRIAAYYVKKDGTGDGRTKDAPANSIGDAMLAIIADNFREGDSVTIYVDSTSASDAVPNATSAWPSAITPAKVTVTGLYDTPAYIDYTANHFMAFADTTYKNLVIYQTSDNYIGINGFNVTFEDSVSFNTPVSIYTGNIYGFGVRSDKSGTLTVNNKLNNKSYTVNFGGYTWNGADGSPANELKGIQNLVINGGNVNGIYLVGFPRAAEYESDVNIVLNGASVSAMGVGNPIYSSFAPVIGGALQIIANGGSSIPSLSAIKDYAKNNNVPYYFMNASTTEVEILGLTDTAGKYTVKEGYGAVATNVDDKTKVIAKDGVITVGEGEWSVVVKEPYSDARKDYINYRRDLSNTYSKLAKGEEVNVVYFGGSVTNGHGASNINNVWRMKLGNWLQAQFPEATVNNINKALGESGTYLGSYRVARDVIAENPDLLVLEYSINDFYDGASYERAAYQYETIVRQVKAALPDCDIVTVLVTEVGLVGAARQGLLHTQAQAHEDMAKIYNIPTLHVGRYLADSLPADWTRDKDWTNVVAIDNVHLTDHGNSIYFEVIKEFFTNTLIYGDYDAENPTAPAELPALQSEQLLDGDITYIAITEELLARSEALGGKGLTYADGSTMNGYNGLFNIAYNEDGNVLVVEFEGTELIGHFDNYNTSMIFEVSVDGGAYVAKNFYHMNPTTIVSGLDSGKHTIAIKFNPASGSTLKLGVLYSRDAEKATAKQYGLTVDGGNAYTAISGENAANSAGKNVNVTIKANAPEGYAFVKWVVVSGNVALGNEYAETATFKMVGEAVEIRAEYVRLDVYGDVTGDYEINADDLVAMKEKLLNTAGYDEKFDLNADGEVNILDLIRIKKILAGYEYEGVAVSEGELALNKKICIGGVSTDSDAVVASGDANVTINGGYYDGGYGASNTAVWAKGNATVIINDGKFTVGADAKGDYNDLIYARDNATVVINGGFFESTTPWSNNGKYYVLNVRNDSTATITVYGGTFVNYNPADGDDVVEGAITVAEGYTVVSEAQANGDIWYTVVAE